MQRLLLELAVHTSQRELQAWEAERRLVRQTDRRQRELVRQVVLRSFELAAAERVELGQRAQTDWLVQRRRHSLRRQVAEEQVVGETRPTDCRAGRGEGEPVPIDCSAGRGQVQVPNHSQQQELGQCFYIKCMMNKDMISIHSHFRWHSTKINT